MYPEAVFPPSLFPPSLYPGSNFPSTFLAAIRSKLLADSGLTAMVNGNWCNRIIPRGRKYPAATLMDLANNRHNAGGQNFLESGSFQVAVYAQTGQTARTIADMAAADLTDASLAGLQWWYESGRLMYFSLDNPLSSDPPVQGPAGSDLFVAVRLFDYVYQGIQKTNN